MRQTLEKIVLLFFFSQFVVASEIKFLGPNLIPCPAGEKEKLSSLEINKSEGASVFPDKSVKLSKNSSFCILLEKNNSSAYIFSPFFSVEEGKKYFFSLFYRQKWEGEGRDKYVGISSFPSIEWYDKNNKLLTNVSPGRFVYGETDWDLRDAILTSPENSRFARIKVVIFNNSEKQTGKFIPSKLWIDNLQFREYIIPAETEYGKDQLVFFPAIDEGFSGKGSKWCKVIDDKEAIKKKAIYIPKTEEKGIVFHSPYFPSLAAGLYRLEARVKVNEMKENVNLGHVDISTENSGTRLFMEFNKSAVKKVKQYISFQDDFIIREPGWWCIRVYTTGKDQWYIDDIRIVPLVYFSENDILSLYPGIEGFVEENISPRKSYPLKILAFTGLFYEDWLEDVFTEESVEIKKIYFERNMHTPGFNRLPVEVNEIFDNNFIILSNVNISALPVRQKNYIREYVRRGGNLIIFAGHQSYRKGSWEKSLLADILPFGVEDIAFFREGIFMQKVKNLPALEKRILWKDVVVYYIQKVKELKDSGVLIKAGDYPFLVARDYFQGRVFFFLGLNLGEKTAERIPFWEWQEWKNLLRELLLTLSKEIK